MRRTSGGNKWFLFTLVLIVSLLILLILVAYFFGLKYLFITDKPVKLSGNPVPFAQISIECSPQSEVFLEGSEVLCSMKLSPNQGYKIGSSECRRVVVRYQICEYSYKLSQEKCSRWFYSTISDYGVYDYSLYSPEAGPKLIEFDIWCDHNSISPTQIGEESPTGYPQWNQWNETIYARSREEYESQRITEALGVMTSIIAFFGIIFGVSSAVKALRDLKDSR